MTRRRLSVALVVLVLVGTPWANAEAQTRSLKPLTAAELEPVAANQGNAGARARLGGCEHFRDPPLRRAPRRARRHPAPTRSERLRAAMVYLRASR